MTNDVTKNILDSAFRTLEIETKGLAQLKEALNGPLAEALIGAVQAIHNSSGRVIVTGMGKSGHIGLKMAATMASTGTPAFFVHPAEASHGDLGMITTDDVVIAFSWSGETVELGSLLNYTRRFKIPLVAITSGVESTLGNASDFLIALPKVEEACPHGLAPTTSTTLQLVISDCLAIALLETNGFTSHDFKVFHPGGKLGANLLYVADLMHKGDSLPLVNKESLMSEALVVMTEKSMGCLGVLDEKGQLAGIITDGDLRRKMSQNLINNTAGEVMTASPKTIKSDLLASATLEIINASNITALFVVDEGKPVGLVHVHDLLRAGVA